MATENIYFNLLIDFAKQYWWVILFMVAASLIKLFAPMIIPPANPFGRFDFLCLLVFFVAIPVRSLKLLRFLPLFSKGWKILRSLFQGWEEVRGNFPTLGKIRSFPGWQDG